MGGTGISGDFQRADCDFLGESGASLAAAWRAGACGAGDPGFVPGGSECLECIVTGGKRRADSQNSSRTNRAMGRRGLSHFFACHFYSEVLAFLAALVSASFLFVLF